MLIADRLFECHLRSFTLNEYRTTRSSCMYCRWALLCQLTNWFNAYCLVRTYSNSFEALATVMGVFYWLRHSSLHAAKSDDLQHTSKQEHLCSFQPSQAATCRQHSQLHQSCTQTSTCSKRCNKRWQVLVTHRNKALLVAAIGVLFRPSSVLFWLPLGEMRLRPCALQLMSGKQGLNIKNPCSYQQ